MQRFAYSCTSYYFDIVLFTVLYKEIFCIEKISLSDMPKPVIIVTCSLTAHTVFILCGRTFVIIKASNDNFPTGKTIDSLLLSLSVIA